MSRSSASAASPASSASRAPRSAHAAEVLPLRPAAAGGRGTADTAPDLSDLAGLRNHESDWDDGPADDEAEATALAGLDGEHAAGTDESEAEQPDATRAHHAGTAAAAPAADDDTLAAWLARIARQDERALEALYDATVSRVNGLVLRILQRTALAEEVVEDVYWQVWRQAPRFDAERGRPLTWLLAIARSRAIDTLRREQRYRHEELPDDDAAEPALGDGAALPPQDLLEATREHAHVHAALASLEPRARQLVALAFFRGLTHEEIAEQQGQPLGTVKSLIRRALQQMRRVMEAQHV